MQSITSLSHGSLFKLASKSAQAKVTLTLKWLGKILESRPPLVEEAAKEESMQSISDRMQFFCYFEVAAGSGAATRLVGAAALRKMYEHAKARHEDVGCSFADIAPLKVWCHLMPQDLAQPVANLVKLVEETMTTMQSAHGKKPSKAATSGCDGAVAQAMALFT